MCQRSAVVTALLHEYSMDGVEEVKGDGVVVIIVAVCVTTQAIFIHEKNGEKLKEEDYGDGDGWGGQRRYKTRAISMRIKSPAPRPSNT